MEEHIKQVTKASEKTKRVYRTYDYTLLFLTLFLVGLGLVFVYSTSGYSALKTRGDAAYYLKRQGLFAVIGVFAMIIVSEIDYGFYISKWILGIRPIYGLLVLSLGLQTYVLFGDAHKGARRWIEVPGIGQFQPSEITKICVIILTAYICSIAPKRLNKFRGFVRAAFYVAPLIVLVAAEDLSTAFVIAGIFYIICFVTSKKILYFVLVGLAGLGVIAAYIFLGDAFRSTRVIAWLNIDNAEGAYQIRRSLYAIASGGFTGKGLGESSLKLGFLPEAHNDMIFAIICEELGIFGAVSIILLFVLLLWKIYIVAYNAPDLFGSFLCVGVFCHIALQVLINIAVVTNSIPATGIPLPFISYGGTSLVLLLCEMGLVLSVSYRIEHVEYV